MPTYAVTGPDGQKYKVTAPNEQALQESLTLKFGEGAPPAPIAPEPSTQPGYTPQPPVYDEFDNPVDQSAPTGIPSNEGGGVEDLLGKAMRGLQIGTQGAGRGLANLVGGVGSLPTAAFNAGMSGIDMAGRATGLGETGVRADYLVTPETIAGPASALAEAMGMDLIDRDEMDPKEQLMHKLNDYGAQAVVGMGGLTSLASKGGKAAKALGPVTEPYKRASGVTYAGDTGAAVGSAIADEVVEDTSYADNPLVRTLVNLFGGLTGATGMNVTAGGGAAALAKGRDIIKGRVDPNAPQGIPASRAEMDTSARLAQAQPTNLSQTRSNISDAFGPEGSMIDLPRSEQPTVGMIADDIGMAQGENIARGKDPTRFLVRDSARRTKAGEFVDQSAPAGADGRKAVGAAQGEYDARMSQLEDELARAQDDLAEATRASAQNPEFDAQNADLEGARARQGETSANLDKKFRDEYEAARATKNAKYDEVDGATPGDAESLYEAVKQVERDIGPVAATSEKNGFAQVNERVKNALKAVVDEETGEVTLRDIDYKDLRALNSELSAMSKEVVAGGGSPAAIRQVKNAIEDQLKEINPEAARYYAEDYAPRFKTGKAGEYERNLKNASRTGEESSSTRPSEFAQKFLRTPEDANALNRAIDVNDSPETLADARDWMLGDLARKGSLTSEGKVRYNKFSQWAEDNNGVIDQFPELRKRVDTELQRAQSGMKLSDDLNSAVAEAKDRLGGTRKAVSAGKRDLNDSPLAKGVGNNPENMVDRVMSSGDPEKQMDELLSEFSGDAEALDGLKAGVRDWIKSKVGVTSANVGNDESARMGAAKLTKLFRTHEKTLAKLYSPEEMNALQRARKLMVAETRLDARATAGSDSHAKFMAAGKDTATQKWRMVEAVLKAKYGVLKGGGVLRTIRTGLASLPTKSGNVQDVLNEMYFNPELAMHLMDRPLKEVGTSAWNAKLNRLMGYAAGARADDDVGN